jgi:rod shape-determining protein MreD
VSTFVFIALGALLAFLQTTWLAGLAIGTASPDLVLIVLTYTAHVHGAQRGQTSGFALGLVEDALSIAPLGFHALVRLASGGVIGLTSGSVQSEAVITPMILVAVSFIVRTIMIAVLAVLLPALEASAGVLTWATWLDGLFTVLLAPLLFIPLGALYRRFARRGAYS